jgi:hypothetical protein
MSKRGAQPPAQAEVRTGCGRRIVVGRLLLDALAPIGRVTLRSSGRPGEGEGMWASLTVDEARLLAGYLLAQAGAVERACRE